MDKAQVLSLQSSEGSTKRYQHLFYISLFPPGAVIDQAACQYLQHQGFQALYIELMPPISHRSKQREHVELSANRVESYVPDNVFARLLFDKPEALGSISDREASMRVTVESLSKVIEGRKAEL
jgi:hypothetical protein